MTSSPSSTSLLCFTPLASPSSSVYLDSRRCRNRRPTRHGEAHVWLRLIFTPARALPLDLPSLDPVGMLSHSLTVGSSQKVSRCILSIFLPRSSWMQCLKRSAFHRPSILRVQFTVVALRSQSLSIQLPANWSALLIKPTFPPLLSLMWRKHKIMLHVRPWSSWSRNTMWSQVTIAMVSFRLLSSTTMLFASA